MTRECHVRFCERLGVKHPGATLPPATPDFTLPMRSTRYSAIWREDRTLRATSAFYRVYPVNGSQTTTKSTYPRKTQQRTPA
jgi:hypothetical protein